MLAGILVCAGLAVMLAGADRLLASAVCRQMARRAERTLGTGSAPVVRVMNVPFLSQLVAGVYREVTLTAPSCTLGSVELQGLTVRLSDVRAPLRRLLAARGLNTGRAPARELKASKVAASATIPFSALTARLPAGLELRRTGTDIGISGWLGLMPVAGTLAVAADGQRISVVPKMLGVKGLLGFVIALPGLPPELAISALRVTEEGLEVAIGGDEVSLVSR